MPLKLNKDARQKLLEALRYRVNQFPAGTLRNKLQAADEAYHLAKVIQEAKMDPTQKVSEQVYSRFQELTNALGREVGETYSAKYITTFLSKSKIFSMTGAPEVEKQASAFNAVMEDQQKETGWRENLAQAFLDVSKYNLGAVEVSWSQRLHMQLSFDASQPSGRRVTNKPVTWSGNAVEHMDLYNSGWDTSVKPQDLPKKGEHFYNIKQHTQVGLKMLIDTLKADPERTLYLNDVTDPHFNLFNIARGNAGSSQFSSGTMQYYQPVTIALGSEDSNINQNKQDWTDVFGSDHRQGYSNKLYTVTKFFLRAVPSCYDVGLKDIFSSTVEIWEIYILDSEWILSTKKLDNLHELLPTVLLQTDIDSLGLNATGPLQVTIPYQKTAKQLMDRVLASADRAIGDRGIFDPSYLNKDDINSRVPEAKVPMIKSLPTGKTIDSVYRQMPFQGEGIYRLYTDIEQTAVAGRKAAGLNAAQQGQFVPGNKTLEEYNDTQGNAEDKTFVRCLMLEATGLQMIKGIIKLNIIQYQDRARVYSSSEKMEIDINPADLWKARVDFDLADTLMPSQYMVSPNVQQLVLQLLTTQPQWFAKYDVPKLVGGLISQSNGFNIEQYAMKGPDGQPAPAAAPAPTPQPTSPV